jgi:hypothetical protein
MVQEKKPAADQAKGGDAGKADAAAGAPVRARVRHAHSGLFVALRLYAQESTRYINTNHTISKHFL